LVVAVEAEGLDLASHLELRVVVVDLVEGAVVLVNLVQGLERQEELQGF
jgi:hypothetical protein